MFKQYLSRAQTRAWSSELPIGDPTGGAAYGEKNDPVTAGLAIAGGSIVGGLISSQGAQSAADTAAGASTQASNASIAEQRRQFDINQANQQPFLTGGTTAFNRLAADLQPGGRFYAPISMANFTESPFYQGSLKRTMDLLSRKQAAGGNYLSGGALDAQARVAAQAVGEQQNNWFNQELASRQSALAPQQSLAGVGPTTANYLGTAGSNMASNIGNAYMSNAGNVGNAAMASAGLQSSAYGGAANMLGRIYGNYGQNPYATGQQLSNQYGSSNVYGAGGGGTNYLSGPGASYMPIGE